MTVQEISISELSIHYASNILNSITLKFSTVCCPLTLISPVGVPGVGHQPVVLSLLCSPPHDLDGVTSQRLACGVLVHSYKETRTKYCNISLYALHTPDACLYRGTDEQLNDLYNVS